VVPAGTGAWRSGIGRVQVIVERRGHALGILREQVAVDVLVVRTSVWPMYRDSCMSLTLPVAIR
jgi:hypothetical protein